MPKEAYQLTFFGPEQPFGDYRETDGNGVEGIRFGTSSWTYPGWVDLVYTRKHRTATEYLREYVRCPLFHTVGADFTFYHPPTENLLRGWREFLPKGFPIVFKVWDRITVDRFQTVDQKNNRHRIAGRENPHFLDPASFEDLFLSPFKNAGFQDHIACFVFEFRSTVASSASRFLEKLDRFFQRVCLDIPCAVEVRSPFFIGNPSYVEVLKNHHLSHVYNHWDRMPPLSRQVKAVPFTGRQVVSRILTPLNTPYATAKKKFAPYDRLSVENILPKMRKDVVDLALRAIRDRLPGYILVNNRAEGCAPMTIRELEGMLRNSLMKLKSRTEL